MRGRTLEPQVVSLMWKAYCALWPGQVSRPSAMPHCAHGSAPQRPGGAAASSSPAAPTPRIASSAGSSLAIAAERRSGAGQVNYPRLAQ